MGMPWGSVIGRAGVGRDGRDLFRPDRAAVQLLDVIDGLKPTDSGRHFAWDGAEIPA